MSEASGKTKASWALRGMIVASVIVPLLVLAAGSWLGWRNTVQEVNSEIQGALAVSSEQVARVFDTHVLLGNRISDLVNGLGAADIAAREPELHERLVGMIAGYSQVSAVVIVDADGRALVASTQFPVDRGVSFGDRDYFQRHGATATASLFAWRGVSLTGGFSDERWLTRDTPPSITSLMAKYGSRSRKSSTTTPTSWANW